MSSSHASAEVEEPVWSERQGDLPLIDEHATDIAAGINDVWVALTNAIGHGFEAPLAAAYARAVGCEPSAASGPRPLAEGSTMPGFRVRTVVPGRQLVLEGRHRFSSYLFTFRLEEVAPRLSRLRAESRAAFPGLFGGAYRLLVIGTHGHALAVRRLLAGIRTAAERRAAAPPEAPSTSTSDPGD